jgi:hypothetical protein
LRGVLPEFIVFQESERIFFNITSVVEICGAAWVCDGDIHIINVMCYIMQYITCVHVRKTTVQLSYTLPPSWIYHILLF